MTKINERISLHLVPSLVFSLVILWGKRDIEFMTWNHTKFLHHEMSFFMKANFLSFPTILQKSQILLFLYQFLNLWKHHMLSQFKILLPLPLQLTPTSRFCLHLKIHLCKSSLNNQILFLKGLTIPSYLDDYVYQLPRVGKLSQPRTNSVSLGTLYPISCHLSYSLCVPSHQKFLANISMVSEPKIFSQAVKEPKWCKAMEQGISSL